MKKLLLSILAISALVSCNKAETTQLGDLEVRFGQSVMATRAPVATIGDADNFKVFGVEHSGDFASAAWAADNFIDALSVKGNGTYEGDRYHYSNAQDQKHSFFAYYPADLLISSAAGDATAPVISFDCATQPDVLWASMPNVLKSTNKVALSMQHRLAQLQLVVKTQAGYIPNPAAIVTTASIEALTKGTMNVETGAVTSTGETSFFPVVSMADVTINDQPQNIGQVVMLPVQSISNVKITLSGREVTVPVTGLALEQGKLTKIVLTVSGVSVDFSVSVNPWIEGGTDGSGDVQFN